MNIHFLNYFFKGDKRTSLLKKNIIASFSIKGISVVTSLLLVPLTLDYLHKELYGLWLTLSSIIMWMNFFDIGLTLGLKNKLTKALAVNDFIEGKKLVSTTYYMMALIFMPLIFIIALIIPFLDWPYILNVPQEYNSEIINVLYLLTIFMGLQMFFNIVGTVAAGFQKTAFSSLFLTLGQILSLILVWGLKFSTTSSSLFGVALIISGAPILITALFSIYLYKKDFSPVKPSLKYIDKSKIKELFGMGIKFFIIQMQLIVLYQSTNLIISHISGASAVGEYNIAYKYLSITPMIFNLIITPIWPAFTDAHTMKDYSWMKRIYKKTCLIYLLVFIALLLQIFLAPYFYKIWIGDQLSIPTMMTISTALFLMINTWDSMQVYMINGVGAVKLQTMVVLIGLIFHIPLAFFLGDRIGASGVIVSMTIINIIYSIIFTYQINRIIRNKGSKIWLK